MMNHDCENNIISYHFKIILKNCDFFIISLTLFLLLFLGLQFEINNVNNLKRTKYSKF